MSLAKTYTAMLCGMTAEKISVEVDISNGLHSFSIVGLGDRAVDEAKDRVAAAIKNSGYVSPKQKNQKVVISLAPADIRKEGPSFDLAMAIGYLLSCGEIHFVAENKLFIGELSLEGNVRRVSGLLPILCQAKSLGFNEIFIPTENSLEASLVKDVSIISVSSIKETIKYLSTKKRSRGNTRKKIKEGTGMKTGSFTQKILIDMSMIRGNEQAKRGLEIAAAGSHNVVMYGPPGTGKTMLAKSFHGILPDLDHEQSIEVTSIHSIAKTIEDGLITRPPFRSPHHTASYPAIVGGGSIPKPGEITLAHRGIIFFDEFAEFSREVMEALRQPLEEREITISRARGTVTFPAQCILIASMNPCPCGMGNTGCTCTPKMITNYKKKISGPIADRVDIWLNVNKIDYQKLGSRTSQEEKSETIAERVFFARNIQKDRFEKHGSKKHFNSEMEVGDIDKIINISVTAKKLLISSAEKLDLSGRAYHRIIKVAQTIVDLENSHENRENIIEEKHILEALMYRQRI